MVKFLAQYLAHRRHSPNPSYFNIIIIFTIICLETSPPECEGRWKNTSGNQRITNQGNSSVTDNGFHWVQTALANSILHRKKRGTDTFILLFVIKYPHNFHLACTSQLCHCLLRETIPKPLDKVRSHWYTISYHHAPLLPCNSSQNCMFALFILSYNYYLSLWKHHKLLVWFPHYYTLVSSTHRYPVTNCWVNKWKNEVVASKRPTITSLGDDLEKLKPLLYCW